MKTKFFKVATLFIVGTLFAGISSCKHQEEVNQTNFKKNVVKKSLKTNHSYEFFGDIHNDILSDCTLFF